MAPDLTCDADLTSEELSRLLELSAQMKREPEKFRDSLAGKSIALLFEKPSLRTRITFELAIQQLGGFAILSDGPIGGREPLKDIARNLDRWVSGIVARTFTQHTIEDLAQWSRVPVVNALSDMWHPCQALADALTLAERFGSRRPLKLAFIGDGNNVARSLAYTCTRLGIEFAIATPPRYEGKFNMGLETHDPVQAVRGAHAVYTDVWASMGSENEAAERRAAFANYQVNDELMAHAEPDAVFMHCLPAKRGEEVTDSVMESPRSLAFEQAENRLHVQKALLLVLLS